MSLRNKRQQFRPIIQQDRKGENSDSFQENQIVKKLFLRPQESILSKELQYQSSNFMVKFEDYIQGFKNIIQFIKVADEITYFQDKLRDLIILLEKNKQEINEIRPSSRCRQIYYRFRNQKENQISALVKMKLSMEAFLSELNQKFAQHNNYILPDQKKCQFLIKTKNELNLNSQSLLIQDQSYLEIYFSKIFVLKYQSQCLKEVKILEYLLKTKKLEQLLFKTFQSKKIRILTNIQLQLVEESPNLIYFLIENEQQSDIISLQMQLKNFIEKEIIQISKSKELIAQNDYFQQNLDELSKKINLMNKFYQQQIIELLETKDKMNYNEFNLILKVTHFIIQGEELDQKLHDQIVEEISKSQCGVKTIVINDEQMIQKWLNFLKLKYQNQNQEFQITTILTISQSITTILNKQLEIQIEGNIEKILLFANQIQDDLKSLIKYYYQPIQCRDDLIQFLQILNFESIFKTELDQIYQNFPHHQLQIKLKQDKNARNMFSFEIYCYNTIQKNQIQQHLEELIKKLNQYHEKEFNFSDFLKYYQFANQQEFENQLEVKVLNIASNCHFVGMNDKIEQVIQIISNFKKNSQIIIPSKRLLFNVKYSLIWDQIIQLMKIKTINHTNKSTLIPNKIFKTLEIFGQEQEIQITNQQLVKEQELILAKLDYQTKNLPNVVIKYLRKYLSNQILQIEKQKKTEIMITQNEENPIQYQIKINNIEINFVQGSILNQIADAVLIGNSFLYTRDFRLQSEAAQLIADAAGPEYKEKCEQFLGLDQIIECGKILITDSFNLSKSYKCIINGSFFQNTINRDIDSNIELKLFLQIEEILKNSIELAINKNISSIVIPILGGEVNGIYYDLIGRFMIQKIIESLKEKSQTSLKKIIIIEKNIEKIQRLVQIIENIFMQKDNFYQVKYQWQWQNNQKYYNYDDWDINQLIDFNYHQYLQQNEKAVKMIHLKCNFDKKPSTHIVDLNTMMIEDKYHKTITNIVKVQKNGQTFLKINNLEQTEEFTNYILKKQSQNILKFEVFLQNIDIQIVSKEEIYQINRCKRKLNKIELLSCDKQIDLSTFFSNKIFQNENIQRINFIQDIFTKNYHQTFNCLVLGRSAVSVKESMNQITRMYESNLITRDIDIPNADEQDLQQFYQILKNKTVSYEQYEKKINIKSFEKQINKIMIILKQMNQELVKFPQNWKKFEGNYQLLQLNQNLDDDFQVINSLFEKSLDSKISTIYRIQNKANYINYCKSTNDIKEINKKRKKEAMHLNKLLWLGTDSQVPENIYKQNEEIMLRTSYWGEGVYLSEQASFADNYAYKIEEGAYMNKKAILCCLVATGYSKDYLNEEDESLIEPPMIDENNLEQGRYDSVCGLYENQKLFVLYYGQTNRIYPNYLVIYG